eukprot:365339-Chlamydomonas_euryale.AAC.7
MMGIGIGDRASPIVTVAEKPRRAHPQTRCGASITAAARLHSATAPAPAPEREDIHLVGETPMKKRMILPKNVRRQFVRMCRSVRRSWSIWRMSLLMQSCVESVVLPSLVDMCMHACMPWPWLRSIVEGRLSETTKRGPESPGVDGEVKVKLVRTKGSLCGSRALECGQVQTGLVKAHFFYLILIACGINLPGQPVTEARCLSKLMS